MKYNRWWEILVFVLRNILLIDNIHQLYNFICNLQHYNEINAFLKQKVRQAIVVLTGICVYNKN